MCVCFCMQVCLRMSEYIYQYAFASLHNNSLPHISLHSSNQLFILLLMPLLTRPKHRKRQTPTTFSSPSWQERRRRAKGPPRQRRHRTDGKAKTKTQTTRVPGKQSGDSSLVQQTRRNDQISIDIPLVNWQRLHLNLVLSSFIYASL